MAAGLNSEGRCAPITGTPPVINAMSVDVEDYYQVYAFSERIKRADWDAWPSRVEANTERVLDVFDSAGVKATFFTLGWVAERHKALLRRVVAEGHELASHGYEHVRADSQTPGEFRADVRRSKAILEDTGGVRVRGYRAATFSIGQHNLWAFEVLAEEGYVYSSSLYPIRHDYYGMPEAPRTPFRPQQTVDLVEFPIGTVRLGGRNFPCGGGGYFRLLPYHLSRTAIRRVNVQEERPSVFYFHPWEIDPGQPRLSNLPVKTALRHYSNLGRMEAKLRRLLSDFRWDRMDRVLERDEDGLEANAA